MKYYKTHEGKPRECTEQEFKDYLLEAKQVIIHRNDRDAWIISTLIAQIELLMGDTK